MVSPMKKMLLPLCFLAGCATAPTPGQVGGATGCVAQGFAATADRGKAELVVAGIVLMPLCSMVASSKYLHTSVSSPR